MEAEESQDRLPARQREASGVIQVGAEGQENGVGRAASWSGVLLC